MRFSSRFDYDNIVFVGAGGTGGYLIPNALRILGVNSLISKFINIYIIDPDVVEQKNLIRQNFVQEDINKYKADVMAIRYGRAFGVDIKSITKKIQFIPERDMVLGKSLIIDTVDNNTAREFIDNYVKNETTHSSWISIGNDSQQGNLVFYDKQSEYKRSVVDIWPNAFTEEVFEEERAAELVNQCALNAISAPQTSAINMTGATHGVNLFYSLISGEDIHYNMVIFDRFGKSRIINEQYTMGGQYIGREPLSVETRDLSADLLAALTGGNPPLNNIATPLSVADDTGLNMENVQTIQGIFGQIDRTNNNQSGITDSSPLCMSLEDIIRHQPRTTWNGPPITTEAVERILSDLSEENNVVQNNDDNETRCILTEIINSFNIEIPYVYNSIKRAMRDRFGDSFNYFKVNFEQECLTVLIAETNYIFPLEDFHWFDKEIHNTNANYVNNDSLVTELQRLTYHIIRGNILKLLINRNTSNEKIQNRLNMYFNGIIGVERNDNIIRVFINNNLKNIFNNIGILEYDITEFLSSRARIDAEPIF